MKAILTGTIDLIATIDGQDGAPGSNGDNGNNGYNTAFISIYKRAETAASAGSPSGELVWNFANANFTSTSNLNGWSLSIPSSNGYPCWVRQVRAVAQSSTYAIAVGLWSAAVKLVEDGDVGPAGYNTAPVYLYKRSATAITTIDFSSTLTYTFATRLLNSTPSGWSQNIPATDGNPLYVIVATAYSNTATDTIAASEWSSPVKMVEDGQQGQTGDTGAAGLNVSSVFLFKRGAIAPAKPTATLTFTFATGVLSGTLSGWSQTMPATDGTPCWVIQATAVSNTATDTIAASEWSEQRKLVEDGQQGGVGASAVQYTIRIVTSDIYVNPKGVIYGGIKWNVYKIEGDSESPVSASTGNHYIRKSGGSWSEAGNNGAYLFDDDGFLYEYNWENEGSPTSVELGFQLSGSMRATLVVPITIMGKMSRNLWYAGIWSSFSGSWEVTDYKAPYFAYVSGGETTYWAFIGSNGTWTKTTAGTPSSSNSNFRPMVNEFKYLISDAIFTAFAKLGSAVFNGDYMFSQHGFMLGFNNTTTKISDGSQYQNIDPYDVFGESFDYQNLLAEVDAGAFPATPANTWCNITEISMSGNGYLKNGCYYTIFLSLLTIDSGDTLSWRINTSSVSAYGGTLLASGSFTSSNTQPYIGNVYFNGSNNSYVYLWIMSTANNVSSIDTMMIKECKFVPCIALNLLAGEIHGASGKFRLFANGDTYFRGTCLETVLEITPTNYSKYCFYPSWYNNGLQRCFDVTKFGRIIRFTGDWSSISAPAIYLNTLLNKMPKDYKFALRGLGDKKLLVFNDATNLTLNFVGGHIFQSDGYHTYTSFSIAAGGMAMLYADYDIDNDEQYTNGSAAYSIKSQYKVERIKWIMKTPDNYIQRMTDQAVYSGVDDFVEIGYYDGELQIV